MFAIAPPYFSGGYTPAGFLLDGSSAAYPFTLSGSLNLATAQSTTIKFLGGSALFGDSETFPYYCSSVSYPSFDTNRFSWYTSDCTLEARVYPTTFGGSYGIFAFYATATVILYLFVTAAGKLQLTLNDGSVFILVSTEPLSLNTWNNVGVSKAGTTWTISVNGVQNTAVSAATPAGFINFVTAGHNSPNYVDHIRWSNIARAIGADSNYYDRSDVNALLILEFDDV